MRIDNPSDWTFMAELNDVKVSKSTVTVELKATMRGDESTDLLEAGYIKLRWPESERELGR